MRTVEFADACGAHGAPCGYSYSYSYSYDAALPACRLCMAASVMS